MPKLIPLSVALVLCALALLTPPAHAAPTLPLSSKISPSVLAALKNGQTPPALIVLAEQADLSAADNLLTKRAKGRFVFDTLRDTADRTQAPVRAVLDGLGKTYRAYYVINMIAVNDMDASTAAQIAALPQVGNISNNPDVRFSAPVERHASGAEGNSNVEWNLIKVRAQKMWNAGFEGKGTLVASADTGVQWDHPALVRKYRGYNRQTRQANHNYHWWDAIHQDIDGGPDSCGYNLQAPCDDYGHGTHTMGTMVGSTNSSTIGVAPKARWLACRNMDNGVGRPDTYIECFEFYLAPWNLNGQNANPNKAPDVVNNSWGCTVSEGCDAGSINVLRTAAKNLRSAGIYVVSSAGNSGSACGSVDEPSAIYSGVTTVGATDSDDVLANFSSRGPVTVDDSDRRKPDLSAPGVSVRSSTPGDSYGYSSGTSMAAPHVSGAVALLWNSTPALRGRIHNTELALFAGADIGVTLAGDPNQSCGGTDRHDIPNNLFGYGRLNIWRSYQQLP